MSGKLRLGSGLLVLFMLHGNLCHAMEMKNVVVGVESCCSEDTMPLGSELVSCLKSEKMDRVLFLLSEATAEDFGARDGSMPLHYAAQCADPAIMYALLQKGAMLDAKTNHNKTPLAIAQKKSPKSLVSPLLQGAKFLYKINPRFTLPHADQDCELDLLEKFEDLGVSGTIKPSLLGAQEYSGYYALFNALCAFEPTLSDANLNGPACAHFLKYAFELIQQYRGANLNNCIDPTMQELNAICQAYAPNFPIVIVDKDMLKPLVEGSKTVHQFAKPEVQLAILTELIRNPNQKIALVIKTGGNNSHWFTVIAHNQHNNIMVTAYDSLNHVSHWTYRSVAASILPFYLALIVHYKEWANVFDARLLDELWDESSAYDVGQDWGLCSELLIKTSKEFMHVFDSAFEQIRQFHEINRHKRACFYLIKKRLEACLVAAMDLLQCLQDQSLCQKTDTYIQQLKKEIFVALKKIKALDICKINTYGGLAAVALLIDVHHCLEQITARISEIIVKLPEFQKCHSAPSQGDFEDRKKRLLESVYHSLDNQNLRALFAAATFRLKGRLVALLYGPVGTGKSTMAQALAWASERKSITINAAGLGSKYRNSASKNLRKTIAGFLQTNPDGVVIIDDIDRLPNYKEDQAVSTLRSIIAEYHKLGENNKFRDSIFIFTTIKKPEDLASQIQDLDSIQFVQISAPRNNAREAIIKFYWDELEKWPAKVKRIVEQTNQQGALKGEDELTVTVTNTLNDSKAIHIANLVKETDGLSVRAIEHIFKKIEIGVFSNMPILFPMPKSFTAEGLLDFNLFKVSTQGECYAVSLPANAQLKSNVCLYKPWTWWSESTAKTCCCL